MWKSVLPTHRTNMEMKLQLRTGSLRELFRDWINRLARKREPYSYEAICKLQYRNEKKDMNMQSAER